jgi:2-phosphoglycerate kinase
MDPVIAAALIGGAFAVIAAIVGAPIITDRLILTDIGRWRHDLPGGFVVVVNGGSGVGKTTLAWALARRFDVSQVLGTDFVREVLRSAVPPSARSENRLLLTSSFLAHHQLNSDLPERGEGGAVVYAYRRQSGLIIRPLVAVINRVRTKREPLVIEGINIVASDLFAKIPGDRYSAIFFVNLYLESRDHHVRRLRERGARAREFPELTDRYINEIEAIREIDTFLKDDAQRLADRSGGLRTSIISIENSGDLSRTLSQVDRALRAKVRELPKG